MIPLFATQKPGFLQLIRLLLLLQCLFLLNACSTLKPEPSSLTSTPDWQQMQAKLERLNSWKILGKASIRTPSKRYTAAIHSWIQADDFYKISLSSTFFGMGASTISGNASHVVLTEAGEPPSYSEQPDELIEEALGVPLPITHLSTWIKALPKSGLPFKQAFNEDGYPETIEQLGWRIEFSRYQLHEGLALPGKIELTNNEIKIIVAVTEWTLI